MRTLSRLGLSCLLSFFIVSYAHSQITKPPRGGLFGASHTTNSALHAINPKDHSDPGEGAQIAPIVGLSVTALAKEPTTGILYGFNGFDATPIRLFIVDPRNGGISGGSGDGSEVIVSGAPPGLIIVAVLGADFSADGTLYAAIEFRNTTDKTFESHLATVGTMPDGMDRIEATLLAKFDANFINALSFDPITDPLFPDGFLWAVSADFGPDNPNRLFKYGIGSGTFVSPLGGFALEDAGGDPPSGRGFGSLQFTCDGTLYGGTLENSIVEIHGVDFSGRFSDIVLTYKDVDGDRLFNLDVDELLTFTPVTDTSTGNTWDGISGVPDIVPFIGGVAIASGVMPPDPVTGDPRTDLWTMVDTTGTGSTVNPAGWLGSRWTYTVSADPQADGGEVFTIDTSSPNEGTIMFLGQGTMDGASLGGFAQATSCNVTNLTNAPVPAGLAVTSISIESFEQEHAFVEVAGLTSADFCVAGPDPRERGIRKGKDRFEQRTLYVPELSNTGTCGDLSQINLEIPKEVRGFRGKVTRPDLTVVEGVLYVIGDIHTTAEARGAVASLPFFETLIDYDGQDVDPSTEDACSDDDLAMHPLSLGGAIRDDFGNVEGMQGIIETVQCDGPANLTRRTTHIYPVRFQGNSANAERINVQTQLNGIEDTILEAYECLVDTSVLATMQGSLEEVRPAFNQGRWEDAVHALEDIAHAAHGDDWFGCQPDGDGNYRNYEGNFVSRALAAAFAVFDRYWLPSIGTWFEYKIPDDLGILLLDTRPTETCPLPSGPAYVAYPCPATP